MAEMKSPRLEETRKISAAACYDVDGRQIPLGIPPEQLRSARLYSAAQAARIGYCPEGMPGTARITLRDQDTLEAAWQLTRETEGEKPVLILNFANPRRPGGGIRENPGTQEEHLCMKTTLLASLESEAARGFYEENKASGTQAQTDAVLFSPHTVVIRNGDLTLREDPFQVSVITVSAPVASRMKAEELESIEAILQRRIRAMLRCAMTEGYERIVLGAWGCGNFRNDPDLVALLFHQVLTERFGPNDRYCAAEFFTHVVMAVPGRESRCYRSFANVFQEE